MKISATRTDKVPNTSATAASSGTDLNGMAAKNAAETIKQRLDAFAGDAQPDAPARAGAFAELCRRAHLARISLAATGFYATPKIHYDRASHRGRPFLYFAYGAALSEVVIDTLTGEHRVVAVDILHDVGRSLNPAIDLGQIEGGFIQGMGWLTTEELVFDDARPPAHPRALDLQDPDRGRPPGAHGHARSGSAARMPRRPSTAPRRSASRR